MTATATALPRTSSRTYPSLRAAWIPLAALCLAFFVEMVDNTLLSIALPTIGRDLGSGTTETRTAMADLAAENVVAVLSGRPPLTPITA